MRELANKFYNDLANDSNPLFKTQKASFLNFAAYALDDTSIYPYWIALEEKDMFDFLDHIPSAEGRHKIIESILPYKSKFWKYLQNNIILKYRTNSEIKIYPDFISFIIYSFVIKSKFYSDTSMELLKCQESIEYFGHLFGKLNSLENYNTKLCLKLYNNRLSFTDLNKAEIKIQRYLVDLLGQVNNSV